MAQSQYIGRSFDSGPLSIARVYELWLHSWETALAALATASRSRMLTTRETAAHKAVIVAERELVATQFALLRREAPHADP